MIIKSCSFAARLFSFFSRLKEEKVRKSGSVKRRESRLKEEKIRKSGSVKRRESRLKEEKVRKSGSVKRSESRLKEEKVRKSGNVRCKYNKTSKFYKTGKINLESYVNTCQKNL